MNKSIKYSIQLAMLKRLKNENYISDFEYDVMKDKIKKNCKIIDEVLV